MPQKIIALLLSAGMLFSLAGCSRNDPPQKPADQTPSSVPTVSLPEVPEDLFSFSQLNHREFIFSSGAGAWFTQLVIRADGSFSGEYEDSEMGEADKDYPNGTHYESVFEGVFSAPVKVDDYTYRIRLESIEYENEVGSELIKDSVRHRYASANGIDGTEEFLIFLPGAPLDKLPADFLDWVGYRDLTQTDETELPFYGLYNPKECIGFSSYDALESLEMQLTATEEASRGIREKLKSVDMPQSEMNENAEALFRMWDDMLNRTWDLLSQMSNEEELHQLTEQELHWIREKDRIVAESGEQYKGGSLAPIVTYETAADLTEKRTYELFEMIKAKD